MTGRGGIRWLADPPGSGYGNAAEAYLSGLREAGVALTWSPLGWPSDLWQAQHGPVSDLARHGLTEARHVDIANRSIEHDVVVFHSTPLWHERLGDEADGRALAAYTTWETDRLPDQWVAILDRYDRVLVPSSFNRDVFAAAGLLAPVHVVPHLAAVTLPVAEPGEASGDPPTILPEDGFVFYAIGPWTTRKALSDVVAAYLAAFSSRDEVTLVIHTTPEDRIAGARLGGISAAARPAQATTWFRLARLLAGRARPPRVVLSTHALSEFDVQRLHARGDCFVGLSRGEGWGLGAFEAGGAGTPVIITGWGGSLDFLPLDYPYLVDYDLVPTGSDEPDEWWRPQPGERWAKARIEHASELMRHVFNHPEKARTWGGSLQRHILEGFSAPVVTRQLLDALGIARCAGSEPTRLGTDADFGA